MDEEAFDVAPVLQRWVENCYSRSRGHRFYSTVYQIFHLLASAPSIISPMFLTKLVVDREVNMYTLAFTLVALAGAVLSLSCSFADKGVQHRQFFNRYSLLAKQIQCELCQPFHTPSHLQQCIEHWFHLSHLAPTLHTNSKSVSNNR